MAFWATPRRLSSSTTGLSSSTSDAVSHFYHLLNSNPSPCNIEKTLSHSTTKFHASLIQPILHKFLTFTTTHRISALRFFVWAGLKPNHRHSPAAYKSASDSLHITHHPQSFDLLLAAYLADALPVSLKTFRILINICRSANLPAQALSLLRRMPEFGCCPDNPSYNAVIRLLADSGRGGDCSALLEEMVRAGLCPDMVTYTSAVKGLCAIGQLEPARVLLSQMRGNGCTPNVVVYSALLDGACRCGDIDSAVEILEEMEREMDDRSGPNVVTYTCLIKCLCEKGRGVEAMGVFDRMGRRGCLPNRVTVATLVNGFCAEGRVADAFELVERVVREGSVPGEECYSSLVVCLLQIGMQEEAERLVERMLETGVRPDGSACNTLMRRLCSQRRVLEGYNWLCKLEKGLMCVDTDVYSTVLAGLCEESHLDESVVLGRKIVDRGIHMERFCINSVEILKMNGHDDLASEIMKLMRRQ